MVLRTHTKDGIACQGRPFRTPTKSFYFPRKRSCQRLNRSAFRGGFSADLRGKVITHHFSGIPQFASGEIQDFSRKGLNITTPTVRPKWASEFPNHKRLEPCTQQRPCTRLAKNEYYVPARNAPAPRDTPGLLLTSSNQRLRFGSLFHSSLASLNSTIVTAQMSANVKFWPAKNGASVR